MRPGFAALVLALVLVVASCVRTGPDNSGPDAKAPNILFVLTDDQTTNTLASMRNVRALLADEGTTFPNFTFSLPRCCPSRASMLTGRYPHNHGVLANGPPDGGWQKFRPSEKSTVATWAQDAGYETALIGKYMNHYSGKEPPPGWSEWFVNDDRGVWARCFNANGERECKNGHPDKILADRATNFIMGRKLDKPFLMWLGFSAPKGGGNFDQEYAGEFTDAEPADDPSFDEADVSDKPKWIRDAPRIDSELKTRRLNQYRNRLRALQTVDQAVADLIEALTARDELKETYIVFTTDNGWHLGEHRLAQGKESPYLHDSAFPLIVRGPGVPAGEERDELLLNNDIAPTFADIAGAEPDPNVDGRSFFDLARGQAASRWRTGVLIDGRESKKVGIPNYGALRTDDLLYVHYEGGIEELYDLESDPFQLENLIDDPGDIDVDALRARVEELAECEAEGCVEAEGG